MLALLNRGSSLILLSLFDFGAPFVRMLMLSHGLSLHELGFASVLVATYGAFEATSDFVIHRFVYSQPREKYHEALAAAHALSVTRGLAVGLIAALLSPFVASFMSVEADWPVFAVLGLIVALRGFESLPPRLAERDYRYGVQFRISVMSNLAG